MLLMVFYTQIIKSITLFGTYKPAEIDVHPHGLGGIEEGQYDGSDQQGGDDSPRCAAVPVVYHPNTYKHHHHRSHFFLSRGVTGPASCMLSLLLRSVGSDYYWSIYMWLNMSFTTIRLTFGLRNTYTLLSIKQIYVASYN